MERLPRFIAEERETGWHVQYDQFRRDADEFIWSASDLIPYDPARVRSEIVARAHQRLQRILPAAPSRGSGSEIETAAALSIEAICNQLNDKATFIQLYNLASLLVASDRRELAREMFTVLSQLVVTVNPDLAGKSSYKLALLSEDIHRETEHLRTCLKLCPSHRAARARLLELDSHAD